MPELQSATGELLRPINVPIPSAKRYAWNIVLFALTILCTLFWGAYMMSGFGTGIAPPEFLVFLSQIANQPALLYRGIGYSFAILAILLSHEMGHYLACYYYGIQATLPFFLPAPITITGTFGAFIKIKSPFPNKRSLFDVGLAGPIAGFVVMIPFLYFGLKWSVALPISTVHAGQGVMGEPLILKFFGSFLLPKGKAIDLHPIGFAAWFACLATSLNLLPIAQLDGGHVSYALFGKRAYYITWIFFAGILGLSINGFFHAWYAGTQWLIYAVLLLGLRQLAGFKHPPTLNDEESIGFARKVWGVIAVIVFALTFMPVTIS